MAAWAPLIMEGRDAAQPVAATRMITGTDVDYGALTRLLVQHLEKQPSFSAHYNRKVMGLERDGDGRWLVSDEKTFDAVVNPQAMVGDGVGGA
ncbi:malate:quinone oxidoreductase [Bradyrhizobium liaoningense]|uniref:malate:quinone oxidoreductase n=1 Tax=Bradyrhizobium liaoningense TaxID=43992 RepID=UPI00387E11BF